MKLVQARLRVRKARESSCHHCRGAVKLVQACFYVRTSSDKVVFTTVHQIENEVFTTVEVL